MAFLRASLVALSMLFASFSLWGGEQTSGAEITSDTRTTSSTTDYRRLICTICR